MRALLTVVREQQSRSKNTVIVDISSEGASFLSIRNGILDNQISCDIGVHEILERLAKGSLPEETLGMIRMLERNQCSGAACDALKASMEKLETELVREYGEKISQLASHGRLATDLLLFAHPDISPWFARFFAKLDFSQFTIPLQPFTVTELTAKDLQNWIQTESGGADTSFLLSCALVHIESQPER
jgi:hypothetical protein